MIYICTIIFAIIFIIFILNLVRKNKLDEKYSILWLFFSVIIIGVSIYPGILEQISKLFDVYYPPALLLLFAIIILGAYIVHIILIITNQNKMIIKLTQEIALLKEEIMRKDNIKDEK